MTNLKKKKRGEREKKKKVKTLEEFLSGDNKTRNHLLEELFRCGLVTTS